jgi:hypothetical protein
MKRAVERSETSHSVATTEPLSQVIASVSASAARSASVK